MSDRPCPTHPDSYRVGGLCPLCPIPYTPALPSNQVGRCGNYGPRMVGPGTASYPQPVCTLPACHPGWHRDGNTGAEWSLGTPFNPVPGHCTDTAKHAPHVYADDSEYRPCPGATGGHAEPLVCRSPRCPRPGANSAGFCCHGCAAASRFGRELLHGARCEEANPGAEESPSTRVDTDTHQYGTHPPFHDWESDHTALVHVLWSARHRGLTLANDADEIARLILGSRWMAAREHRTTREDTPRV